MMFEISISGTKVKVNRKLTLPKTGSVPALLLSDHYSVQLELGGLDPKSPTGKEILKKFANAYAYDLNATRKKYDDACVKAWTDVAILTAPGKANAVRVEKAASDAQKEVVKIWNDFNKKRAKPLAGKILKSVADEVAKKAKEDTVKTKVAFSSDDLKENRVGILSAILGALTLGAASGSIGWIVASLGGLGALARGYRNAWQIAQEQSTDTQVTLNRIHDGFASATTTLAKLKPSLDHLEITQRKLGASMVSARAELNRMEKDLSNLEQRARKEKAVAEGKYISELRTATEQQHVRIQKLQQALQSQDKLSKAVQEAIVAVETAAKSATAIRGKWDKK